MHNEPLTALPEAGTSGAPVSGSRTPNRLAAVPARLERTIDRWPVWLRWLVCAFGLVVATVGLAAPYVHEQPWMSRADEYVYIDAVDKATHGDLTQRGELIDEYALTLLSCRGVEGALMGAPCGTEPTNVGVPWDNGHTSADIHPPTYYFLTAGLARAVQVLTPVDDLLSAARVTSAVWVGLGLTLVVGLARALGATRLAAGAAALLALLAPHTRWVATFVTPDALNIVVGALVLLVAVQVARERVHPAWLVAATFAVGTIKAQNALVGGMVVLLLAIVALRRWYQDRSGRPVRTIAWAVAAFVAGVVPQFIWMTVRSATAMGPAPGQGLGSPPLGLRAVLYDTTVFLRGVVVGPDATYPPAWTNHSPLTIHGELVSWIMIGGLVGLALFVRGLPILESSFARAGLLAFLIAGPALRVALYLVDGSNFGIPVRYGLVLFPAMIAATAVAARRTWVASVLLGTGLVLYAVVLTGSEYW